MRWRPDAVARIAAGPDRPRSGPRPAALARAVAILGDDVPLRHAAAARRAYARCRRPRAADALAAVEVLLAREPLRFVHPLVRHAVELRHPGLASAPAAISMRRGCSTPTGAEPEQVAAHLLLGRAEGNAWVVEQLRAAARPPAIARRAARRPARYLQRALEEPPPPARSAREVLAELGEAEAAAGLSDRGRASRGRGGRR